METSGSNSSYDPPLLRHLRDHAPHRMVGAAQRFSRAVGFAARDQPWSVIPRVEPRDSIAAENGILERRVRWREELEPIPVSLTRIGEPWKRYRPKLASERKLIAERLAERERISRRTAKKGAQASPDCAMTAGKDPQQLLRQRVFDDCCRKLFGATLPSKLTTGERRAALRPMRVACTTP